MTEISQCKIIQDTGIMTAPHNKSGWKGPLEARWSNSLFTAEPTFSPAPKLDRVAQDLVRSSTDYLQGGGSIS